jgi:hypothetical protein
MSHPLYSSHSPEMVEVAYKGQVSSVVGDAPSADGESKKSPKFGVRPTPTKENMFRSAQQLEVLH